ncbi:phosphoribosylglycinamide formyltransferase [Paraferrimonas haliotis]|uniref:Phosphoribosylglycinamide formyltransferase n=1 Tax=Paraferrimonas haliotis TaxID=2013866 RepID=A0AA37TRE5_9GAMM|nr:phosphoribosylglycinamide formyltransferase [Paraferrimonas haliotis]GLS84263.1 phosphoribosylglycinamide formyltransferase [Paraferrimonas haliotis]
MKPARIAVLISGHGSNLQAIIDANTIGNIDVELVAVIANKANAYGLQRAAKHHIPAHTVEAKPGETRECYDARLQAVLDDCQADFIVLAGFMRILSDAFVERNLGKMVNIHPSLLPLYPGLNTHQKAIDNGDSIHGASVHFVTPKLDSGPIILQAQVPVFAEDDIESLAARVHTQEHTIYPLVVHWLSQGRLHYQGGHAVLDGQVLASQGYANDD